MFETLLGFRFLEKEHSLRVAPPFFSNHLGFVILFISSLDLELDYTLKSSSRSLKV